MSVAMSIFERLKYAIYVLIAVTMVLFLMLSLAEGLGVIRNFDIGALMFHPLFFLPVFVIGLAVAPSLSERMPVSGDLPTEGPREGAQFGYAVRMLALMFLGLVLAALLAIAVFILERLL